MELRSRSSRSRSNTPSLIHQSDNQESYVTQSVRITRSKANYEDTSTSERILSPIDERMGKAVLKTRFVTSDYSSDDGENEVTSTLQNFKNQTIENSLTTKVNGELSALKVYQQAGEYWNMYPKTDYTYSQHSKDRVEISPGVIQMPNMSRKSIRNSPITNTSPSMQFIANKACSTDSFLNSISSIHDYSNESAVRPRNLFVTSRQATTNNTVNSDRHKQQHYASSWSSRYSSVESINVVVRIWRYLLTWTYFLYKVQSQSSLWLMKRFYRFACWVLLMDRWLLTKTSQHISGTADSVVDRQDRKVKKLIALCVIPLLLLGGWLFLWGLAGLFPNRTVAVDKMLVIEDIPLNHPSYNHHSERLSASEIALALTREQLLIISQNIRNMINIQNIENNVVENSLRDPNFITLISERLKDITLQELHNNRPNIAADLNTEHSAKNERVTYERYSEEDLVDKLLQNPMFFNVIKNVHKDSLKNNGIEQTILNQAILIKQLQKQIDNFSLGFVADSQAEFRTFKHQLQRCCRNSFIGTEKYVLDIIKDIFQAPSNLNQADFNNWLRNMFLARDDLEDRLGNLTLKLNDKYDALVEESGRLLMDEVAQKLRNQVLLSNDKRATEDINYELVAAKLRQELRKDGPITTVAHDDEHIKRTVKGVLIIYDADKTGLVDYALGSAGAEVVSTKCTEPYHYSTAVWTILGVPLWYIYKSPQTVLLPSVNPGECWAFQNFPGYMIIKLSHRIHIEAISYEHVSKLLIPNGRIDSAPKSFSIYGIVDPNDNKHEPFLLGEFTYDVNGDPLQFFVVTGELPAFGFVELRVNTNHGNPNYTCLYRLRVHGMLALDQPT